MYTFIKWLSIFSHVSGLISKILFAMLEDFIHATMDLRLKKVTKYALSILPILWGQSIFQRSNRSFQRDTVIFSRSKGYKITSVKLWGWFHCLWLKPGPHAHGTWWAEWQNFFSNLQIWLVVTLQIFVVQRSSVPL